MKYQTLTSTLVLTFLLAGAGAQAMEDETGDQGSTPAVIQPLGNATELDGANTATPATPATPEVPAITAEDLLTLSTLNPDDMPLIQKILGGHKAGATTQDQEKAAEAAKALQQKITEKKNLKNSAPQEEETIVGRFYAYWFPTAVSQPSHQGILSAEIPLEILPEKNALQNTAVNLQTVEQATETPEESSLSLFSKLNPWNWWGGSVPDTDAIDQAVSQFSPMNPVDDSVVKPQTEGNTETQ